MRSIRIDWKCLKGVCIIGNQRGRDFECNPLSSLESQRLKSIWYYQYRQKLFPCGIVPKQGEMANISTEVEKLNNHTLEVILYLIENMYILIIVK